MEHNNVWCFFKSPKFWLDITQSHPPVPLPPNLNCKFASLSNVKLDPPGLVLACSQAPFIMEDPKIQTDEKPEMIYHLYFYLLFWNRRSNIWFVGSGFPSVNIFNFVYRVPAIDRALATPMQSEWALYLDD